MTDHQPRLSAASADMLSAMRDQRDPRLNATLKLAVDLGWTQTELARVLDVSKQAIHQRVTGGGNTDSLPTLPAPPPPPARRMPPRPSVDEATAAELRRLHGLCARPGVSAAGSPAPEARRQLVATLERLHYQDEVPVHVIARAMRVPPKSVWNRLAGRRTSRR